MRTYTDILRNTLETMAADAEDKGKDCFCITLDFNDAKILIDGLTRLEPTVEEDRSKIAPIYSPLADTVEGMLHPDYKERFKAEYQQTKIRYEKLKAFCNRIEAAMMTSHEGKKVDMPAHDCPYELLRTQQGHMGLYLHDLEIRAVIEGIEL